MTCPRCGAVIDGFPCSQCGFPVTFKPRKVRLWYKKKVCQRRIHMNPKFNLVRFEEG